MKNTLTEAAAHAYQDLYDNHEGMLDDLSDFWSRSASYFKDNPYVIGYEIINEPFAGDFYEDPLLLLPGNAGRKNLARMYVVLESHPSNISLYHFNRVTGTKLSRLPFENMMMNT